MKNEIEKPKPFDPREDAFCVFYTSIGSETFSKKEKSATEAGYSEGSAKNTATKLLRRPDIIARIQELHSQNMSRSNINPDTVLANIVHDRELARGKNDFSSALRADELLGKFLCLFTDKHSIVTEQTKQQTQEQSERTKEMAAMLEEQINKKYNTVQLENVTELQEISGEGVSPPTPPRPDDGTIDSPKNMKIGN
jgi:phage terminase small subunit